MATMTSIRGLDHCYDSYKDLLWITFTDLSMGYAYSIPVDRRCNVIELVDMILSGEWKQWLDDF